METRLTVGKQIDSKNNVTKSMAVLKRSVAALGSQKMAYRRKLTDARISSSPTSRSQEDDDHREVDEEHLARLGIVHEECPREPTYCKAGLSSSEEFRGKGGGRAWTGFDRVVDEPCRDSHLEKTQKVSPIR